MSGFGMTAVLLEHAPIAKHPWLTSALVAEEVAIQEHAERTVFVLDDDTPFNGEIAQALQREWNPVVFT